MRSKLISILKAFFVVVIILLLINLVLAFGGQETLLPSLPNLSIFAALLTIVWIIVKLIDLIGKKQWARLTALLLVSVAVFVGANFVIKLLADDAQNKADKYIADMFLDKKGKYNPTIDKDTVSVFNEFQKHYNPSDVRRIISVPMYRRYDYVVRPPSIKPFMVTLWMSGEKEKIEIYIYTRGIDNYLKRQTQ